MVKADAKRDYYADLELPSTADAEEIKKQFRSLAKQYHPDRNPGKEVEVLAKFQAVQAAHEILSDPQQKTRYDGDRAKLNRFNNLNNNTNINNNDTDPYSFRKPPPKPAAATFRPPFAPAPPRARTTRAPFDTPNGRPKPSPASSGAEKLNAFTRPTQSWDRARFDEAARADALRGFASMKNGQSTPQPPPRPPRHPTAPRAFANGPSPDMPPPQGAGFPGMSRTANTRPGFAPATPGGDEPMAPRNSAYASYSRGERPQASNAQSYFPDPAGPHSPTMSKQTPTVSPLRHVRSSGFDESRSQRPPMSRQSSKYATTGGERIDIGGPGLARSSSVRNSPVERGWDDNGHSDWQRPHSHYGPPLTRHRSESPHIRENPPKDNFVESESSSSDDELPTMNTSRPKAQPRRPRPKSQTEAVGAGYRSFQPDNPALTGQIPNTNYTKIVDNNTSQYHYPPPGSPNGPTRRPFPNMTTPGDDEPPRAGFGGINRSETWAPKYDPFHPSSRTWSKDWGFSSTHPLTSGSRLNGLPSWAIPSSVYPGFGPKSRPHVLEPDIEHHGEKSDDDARQSPDAFDSSYLRSSTKADLHPTSSSHPAHESHHHSHHSHGPHESQYVSQEDINTTFSAADWDGKFTSGDEYFRPTGPPTRERRSPTRTTRARARSLGKGAGSSQDQEQPTTEANEEEADNPVKEVNEGRDVQPDSSKAAAFQSGKFSAEEWAEKLRNQKWSIPNNELNVNRSKTPKRGSKSTGVKKAPAAQQTSGAAPEGPIPHSATEVNNIPSHLVDDPDAMDIDDRFSTPPPTNTDANGVSNASAPETASDLKQSEHPMNGIDLNDLAKTAPFAPSGTGLKDLDDLASAVPFESRASAEVRLQRQQSAVRRLNLPRPPKTLSPPLGKDITQERWEAYVHDMNDYMHDWSVFNIKMIEHFRSRQDLVNLNMARTWISNMSDGPSVEYFDCDMDALDGPKAGYGTYMAWLQDDARCRTWWEEANERHRVCLEGLGKVRERVKRLSGSV